VAVSHWTCPCRSFSISLSLFFFAVLGLNSDPSPWVTPPALFHEGFFWDRSHELFARTGFESRSSWSLPPELGLQVWATGAQLFCYFPFALHLFFLFFLLCFLPFLILPLYSSCSNTDIIRGSWWTWLQPLFLRILCVPGFLGLSLASLSSLLI
jgi:hypothetical protein